LAETTALNHCHALTVAERVHGEATIATDEVGLHDPLNGNLAGLPAVLAAEMNGTHRFVLHRTFRRREMSRRVSALQQRILCETVQ
jgi:hypothetical protein